MPQPSAPTMVSSRDRSHQNKLPEWLVNKEGHTISEGELLPFIEQALRDSSLLPEGTEIDHDFTLKIQAEIDEIETKAMFFTTSNPALNGKLTRENLSKPSTNSTPEKLPPQGISQQN
eukprot:Lithocolla_globosa_v1_NODE_628_length_3566_cov_26.375107.p6 type:complete len:118 gc:universal NODE_628_length_3566_cov_26.375107:1924-2277(+)